MREYRAEGDRELQPVVVYAGFAFGIGMMVLAVLIRSIYTGVVGAVIFLAVLLTRTIKVSEQGIITSYNLLLWRSEAVWHWDEIMEILWQPHPSGTKVALHFTKESLMARRLIFSVADAEAVCELAQEMNPKIEITEED